MRIIRPNSPGASSPRFLDWLRLHGVNPNVVFRLDVHGDRATVHEYELTADGNKFALDDGEAAVREPYEIALNTPLPI